MVNYFSLMKVSCKLWDKAYLRWVPKLSVRIACSKICVIASTIMRCICDEIRGVLATFSSIVDFSIYSTN